MTSLPLRRAAFLGTLLAVLGCTGGEGPVRTRLVVPSLEVSDSPRWTGRTGDEPAVATVGGLPIPASRLERALRAAGPDADPMVVARALADAELLAQEAVRGKTVRVPEPVFERELVQRLIDHRFREGYGPAQVRPDELRELYAVPAIRSKYSHLETFSVQDYQWTCCNGDPRQCDTPEIRACFDAGKAAMEAVRAELTLRPPDPEDIPLVEDKLRNSAPRIAFQEYDFGYDRARSMQRGSVLIDTAVVDAAVRTPKGTWTGPVRSNFGWHVLYVREIIPAENRDLTDPEVAKDLATFFLPRFQNRRLMEYLATLLPVANVGALAAYFKGHEPPGGDPRYPVETYPESLRDALARQSEKQADEPL